MKKILNGLGVFGSIILTVVLSVLIFVYVVVLNVKFSVSEKGMANIFKKIDIVETLKNSGDESVWEDFAQLAEKLNLSENQFEQILNSDKVKKEIGGYFGEVLSSTLNDNKVYLTKDKIEKLLNIAVDEYNKVSDIKISEEERQKIVNSFDEEMITNLNEELSSINLTDIVESEFVKYIKLADNLLFGSYTLVLLVIIIAVICLIALFRFSWYKWMGYVKVSTTINGIIFLFFGLLILLVPLQDMEIIMPFRKIFATKMFITTTILFILSIGLIIGKKYVKKHIENKNLSNL